MADTSVSFEPNATLIAETAIRAAALLRGFGLEPKVALCQPQQLRQPRHAFVA